MSSGVHIITLALSLACFGLPVAGVATDDAEAAKLENPVASSPESIATGRAAYEKHCAACHGVDGKGLDVGEYAAKPADLTREKYDHGSSDGEIYTVIKNGVGPDFFMDAWGGRISESELWSLVNYLRTLRKQ